MIDTHVHLRDGKKQSHKETIARGLSVAKRTGLQGLFDMPNCDPALTTRKAMEGRLEKAYRWVDEHNPGFFYGVYGGVTNDQDQLVEMLEAHNDLFPYMVGLKMFAGHSTGNMGIIGPEAQSAVFRTLAEGEYEGVLAIHCEKEEVMAATGIAYDHENPITHAQGRPPGAEVESVKDMLLLADEAGYAGGVHIVHVSVPEVLDVVEEARGNVPYRITTEVSPHHALLHDGLLDKYGAFVKMNPPLRPKHMQEGMLEALMRGRVDMIGTDHAPHTYEEKMVTDKTPPSGIPGLPFYPFFLDYLLRNGMSEERLADVTHNNIIDAFDIPYGVLRPSDEVALPRDLRYESLIDQYGFDPFKELFEQGVVRENL